MSQQTHATPNGFAVCTNPSCRQTYPLSDFDAQTRDVRCKKCEKGYVVGRKGEVTLSQHPDIHLVLDDKKIERELAEEGRQLTNERRRIRKETDSYLGALLYPTVETNVLETERKRLATEYRHIGAQIDKIDKALKKKGRDDHA